MKPKFASNQAALTHYQEEISRLENQTGRGFSELWWEAENSAFLTPDQEMLLDLARKVRMCRYLVEQDKNQSKE